MNEETIHVPIVTIGLSNSAEVAWQKSVYKKLSVVLESFPNVDIAYIRSSLFRESPPSDYVPLEECQTAVNMGSSISVGKRGGTLGGFVTVEYGGKTQVMGITANHVIVNDEMTEGMKSNVP